MRKAVLFGVCLFVALGCISTGWTSLAFAQATLDQTPIPSESPAAASPSDEIVAATQSVPADSPSAMYASPFAGNLWERPFLLGDLGGSRDQLLGAGYSFNVSSTQFYQGVTNGGAKQEFAYSGRMDYLLNVDGEKSGLWKGFFVTLHGETRYGDTVNLASGAIMPVNSGVLFPVAGDTVTALTGVKFTQALSEHFITFAGKINTLDELKQPYAAGRGVDAFMNAGLIFPAAASRTIPYSTLGAGFAILQDMQPIFSFMILDTNNTPTTSGFESFFDNGVSIVTKLDIPVTFLGRPGHQGVWGTYSSGTYIDLQPTAYYNPVTGPLLVTGQDTGSWSIFYSADQALYVDPCNPKRSFGLFTNLGLADDGPSPIRWSANVGLGGSSPLVSRPLDTFGIGYTYVAYSGPVQTLAPALLPVGNDHAVEFFYNYAVTPWFRLTPDLQVIVPAREQTLPPAVQSIDTALVIGLRAKLDF